MIWIAPSEKDTANSASDARASEQALRRQLIESCAVDEMVDIGPNNIGNRG